MNLEVVDSVLELIGSTPILRLDRIRSHFNLSPILYAKLESFNPGGSIKDRVALKIVEEAEKSGELQRKQPIVELTSGSMGIGLAILGAIKGHPFTAVMSRGNSPERRKILKAFGAKVVLVNQVPGAKPGQVTREDLEMVERKTQQIVRKLNAFRPDQFNNQANPLAHQKGTGEEIWTQMEGKIDYFVAMVGTAGTFVGISRVLKKHNPRIRCLAVEPKRATVLAGKRVVSTKHKIQGGGYAFIPPLWDTKLADGYLAVTDREAIAASRLLAMKEGILAGFSGGANIAASVKLAKKIDEERAIVTIIPDTGLKYLSTDLFR